MYDTIIIGSGPAGLSAAVYAARARLDAVVLEKAAMSGGQMVFTDQVDNYLGLNGKSGFELAMAFREHAEAAGATFQEADVTDIQKTEEGFVVLTEAGEQLQTKTVVLATGAIHRHLGVPGEAELAARGVSYCATCDGAFFRNRIATVAGGGDTALSDALYLSRLCEKVYLVHRRDSLRGNKALQEAVFHTENIEFLPCREIKEIQGDGKVEAIKMVDNRTGAEEVLETAAVFIAVGMEPVTGYAASFGVLDGQGYVIAGEDGRSPVEGIFAAGDVRTKAARQIATAVGDGAAVIQSVEMYLQGR